MSKSAGKIFLSEQRGSIRNELYRHDCIFNFESYFNEHRTAFNSLYLFNDEVLEGNASMDMELKRSSYVMLLPITGDLQFIDHDSNCTNVGVGQLLVAKVQTDAKYSLRNGYQSDAISFLQIWVSCDDNSYTSSQVYDLALEPLSGSLQPVISADRHTMPFNLNLGSFAGRAETTYEKSEAESKFFCFVIAGAFEVEGRLMQAKDGLALWGDEKVEVEALSNHALLLSMEFKLG